MKSVQYRVPANDDVENRARFITRPKFHRNSICTIRFAKVFLLLSLTALLAVRAPAQTAPPPPPPPPTTPAAPETAPPGPLTEKQLENLVSRIALYPDPLLAQILTASTFGNEIPEAAAWADEHSNLKGEALANAIREDNLQWNPSVLALLPFPSSFDMMGAQLAWIERLGNAVPAG